MACTFHLARPGRCSINHRTDSVLIRVQLVGRAAEKVLLGFGKSKKCHLFPARSCALNVTSPARCHANMPTLSIQTVSIYASACMLVFWPCMLVFLPCQVEQGQGLGFDTLTRQCRGAVTPTHYTAAQSINTICTVVALLSGINYFRASNAITQVGKNN